MVNYTAEPGDIVVLRLQMKDGSTGVFPQLKLYNSSDALIATKNLSHKQKGLYTNTWEATDEGAYYTQTIVYTDSGHTIQSDIDDIDSDSIKVAYRGKPQFGFSDVMAVLPKDWDKDIKDKLKELEEKVEETAFNPSIHKVELKNPIDLSSNFDEVKRIVAIQVSRLKDVLPQLSDLENQFKKISKTIDNSQFNKQVKKLDDTVVKIDDILGSSSEVIHFFKTQFKEFIPTTEEYRTVINTLIISQLSSEILKLNEMLARSKAGRDVGSSEEVVGFLSNIKIQLNTHTKMLEAFNQQESKRFAKSVGLIDKILSNGMNNIKSTILNNDSGNIEEILGLIINELLSLKSSININNISEKNAFKEFI